MKILLKCSASALALLAAASLTQAEPNEKPSVEREQVKPQQKGNEPRKTEQMQPAGRAESEQPNKGQKTGQTERNATPGAPDRAARGDERVPAQSGTHAESGNEHRQAENAGKQPEGGRGRVAIRVTPEQKTRLHDIIGRDSAIHRYHRSDINFSLNVGTRIPDTFEFYDVPPQFVEYDPEFQGYKIIVLDDVVLIVDPETREIVDVIET